MTRAAPSIVPPTETKPPASAAPPSTGPRKDGSSQSWPPTAGIAAPTRATVSNPATPASTPESACAAMIRRPTGTPDISAAR